MPDLEWRETAREGLRSNFEYIADDNPAAALALLEEIETKFAAKTVVQPASRPHSAKPPAQDGRDAQTTLICYSEHRQHHGAPAPSPQSHLTTLASRL